MPLCYLVSRNLPRKPPWRPLNRPKGAAWAVHTCLTPRRATQRLQKRRSHQVRANSDLCSHGVYVGLCLGHHVAVSWARAWCFPSKMDSNAPSSLPVSRRLDSQIEMASARLNLDGSAPPPPQRPAYCHRLDNRATLWVGVADDKVVASIRDSPLNWTIGNRARLSDSEDMPSVNAVSREMSFSMCLDDDRQRTAGWCAQLTPAMGSTGRSLAFIRDDAHALTMHFSREASEGWNLVVHAPQTTESLSRAQLGKMSSMARRTSFLIYSFSLAVRLL